MSTPHGNPFVLPGIGDGAADQNPLLASMEMMRQAWQNMSGAGLLQQPVAANPMSTEDLDKHIADMRAVESWLRLNLSMLSSSIQALEVQRATLCTLKSYMGFGAQGSGAQGVPSPLDVALGIKPPGQARIKPARAERGAQKDQEAAAPLSEAAQAWWDMLQQQFNTLAAATAASMTSSTQPASAAATRGSGTEAAPSMAAAPVSDGADAAAGGAPRKRTNAARKAPRKTPRKA